MVRGDYSGGDPYAGIETRVAQFLTTHLEQELRTHFSEAWISGFELLIPKMTNDERTAT